ncbi:hypothetical protein [Halovenus salina]|nr:hypothetical protein [Halovenus salina]
MQQKYENFDEREMGDGTYLVGDPVEPHEEPIRIDTGWFDGEPGEKRDWEYIVGEIVASDLQEGLQLQEGGEGTIYRDQAVENILDADFDSDKSIVNRDQATAIVDYFLEEGALTATDGELVVLHDPTELTGESSRFDSQEREYHVLSWAAAIDTCIDYMQDTLDTFEEARERLKEETSDVKESDVSEVEKEVARVGQELKNLGPGAQVPDPSELSADQKERYETLKEDFAYYKSLYEVKQEQLVTAEKGIEKLRRNIKRLRGAKDVYESKVGEMRKAALQQQVFPSEDIDVAQNMAGLITSLSDVEDPREMAENLGDAEELNDSVDDMMESIGEVTASVEEGLDSDEQAEIESDESELQIE